MNDERAPRLWWGMWKRYALACGLIVAVSFGGALTVALNARSDLAKKLFRNTINAPRSVVVPEYNGGPETFLVLGSDRREGSKDAYDKTDPPHSDTMLLVRFDPEQGQTSVLSIPRDLMVNITTSKGVYSHEKINAAYTIGSKLGRTRGGMLLAAETIKKEVFPGLTLNGIVDVNFKGFIKVVDALGCAYVNVDHRYFNLNTGSAETNYTSINLQPGYQKLCYENALDYVRYRHTDSDFVRVARQQDFIRSLREQVSAEDVIEHLNPVANAIGHAIVSTVHASGDELQKLAKLIAFSQSKPLRQVKFLTSSQNALLGGGSYVTSTPQLERETLDRFLYGHEQLQLPAAPAPRGHSSKHSHAGPPHPAGLVPTSTSGDNELVKASVSVPFRVLYPTLQTAAGVQQDARAYTLQDQSGRNHHAYVVVWEQNVIGGYYDFEGTDWLNPPLFAHSHSRLINGRRYLVVDDGSHIHVVGWRSGGVLYWVTNTLLEELSNEQVLAIARSARALH